MRPAGPEFVERISAILSSRDLTLHQVSERSRALYGRSSPHFVPHNLYYSLNRGNFSPSLQQLFTLSKISAYSLHDWLRAFGFDLEEIPRLQVRLPSKRTTLLNSAADDPEAWIPWFQNKPGNISVPPIAPIGKLLDSAQPIRLRWLMAVGQRDFIFAKVGREDAFAFPELLPGSIVRANARLMRETFSKEAFPDAKSIFLVEHGSGYCCCRLHLPGRNRIVPAGTPFPQPATEVRLGKEARILGVLDLEIRCLLKTEPSHPPKASEFHPLPDLSSTRLPLSALLRLARRRSGLSFREASAASRQVALELGNEQYFMSPGSLSDHEAINRPPRHVHKVITLCIVYGINFSEFLTSAGLDSGDTGTDPIPDAFVSREALDTRSHRAARSTKPNTNGFLEHLSRKLVPAPFFLRRSLVELSGLRRLSLNDVFWLGGALNSVPPLGNSILAIVNRYKKRPVYFPSREWWQQPVYLVLRRDGTYLAGCCRPKNDALAICEYSPNHWQPIPLGNRDDAEVIGQIVTIVRKL